MYLYVDMLIMIFFFFKDPATTEIYTLSLRAALPICIVLKEVLDHSLEEIAALVDSSIGGVKAALSRARRKLATLPEQDRKSTRLNSSHANISYAVFCLKKKNTRYRPRLNFSNTIPPS